MKGKTIFGMFVLMVVGVMLSTTMVSAYRGDSNTEGPNFNEARHESMETAFETMDYETWYQLMTEDGRHSKVVEVVTEDNFAKFVEAHDAAENGDYETAAQLRAELGLNNGHGPRDGTGFGKGMRQGSKDKAEFSKGIHERGQGMHWGFGECQE